MTQAHLHLLKNQIAEMNATIRHLDSVLGGHLKSFEKTISKISGGKPVKIKTSSLHSKSIWQELGASSVKLLTGSAVRSVLGQSDGAIASGSSNRSQGQLMGQLASAITRAMTRNL